MGKNDEKGATASREKELAASARGLKRILKIQPSLTAHWHDKGADWRGLAHTPAHHRSRLSDSVKNGNAFRTVHMRLSQLVETLSGRGRDVEIGEGPV